MAGAANDERVSLLKKPDFSHNFEYKIRGQFYLLLGQIIDNFLHICLYVNPYTVPSMIAYFPEFLQHII